MQFYSGPLMHFLSGVDSLANSRRVRESKEADATAEAEAEAAHLLKARAAAAEAGRPKSEPAPGSLEYQALHPEWRPEED